MAGLLRILDGVRPIPIIFKNSEKPLGLKDDQPISQ
jgi:hypothetical protein